MMMSVPFFVLVIFSVLHIYQGEVLVPCNIELCIKVGFSYATGTLGISGIQMKNGYILWAETVNNGIGIKLGDGVYNIELIGYDDMSNQSLSSQYYQQLISQDDVDYLFGPYGSSFSIGAAQITEPAGMVLIWSSAADDSCYNMGFNLVFGVVTTGSNFVSPLVNKLKSLGAKNVAIGYSTDGFSTSVQQGALASVRSVNLTLLVDQAYSANNVSNSTMLSLLNEVQPLNPDIQDL